MKTDELFKVNTGLQTLSTSTKKDREEIAKHIVNEVHEGNADPLEVLIVAKKGIEVYTLIEKNVRSYAEGKPLQKGYETLGASIIEKKTPDTYDFGSCDDVEYNRLFDLLEDTKKKLKDRETFLKSLKDTVYNGDGEAINPPAVTFGKQGLAITLK